MTGEIATEETVLEKVAMSVARFFLNTLGSIVNLSIIFMFLYFAGHIVLRFLVRGNNKEEFSKVSGQMRDGCKDIIASFKNVMPGIAESAKFWSEEKIAEIRKLCNEK